MDYDDGIPQSLLREGLRRREPSSETGVDDFDLADYANRLPISQREIAIYPPSASVSDAYVTHTSGRYAQYRPQPPPSLHRAGADDDDDYEEYPSPPIFSRPFSVNSHPSFSPQSPSISHSHESMSPKQYPISPRNLPPFLAPLSPTAAKRHATPADSLTTPRAQDTELDMDISHFPAYSRAWYEKPSPTSYQPPGLAAGRQAALGYNSKQSAGSRSNLPWDDDLYHGVGSDSGIDPITKRERIRMLERDFGKDAEDAARKAGPVIGSVNDDGKLITSGPKKRMLVRWSQVLLPLIGGGSTIYGALFIKPPSPAPPTSTAPAFVLYAAFVLSFFASVYLVVFRPCCCGKRNKPTDPLNPANNGMFVLPVQGFPGPQQKKKKPKKGQPGQQDVQVNLIIDPRMLQQQEDRVLDRLDEEDGLTNSYASTSRTQQSRNRRRTAFEGLALENQWKAARSSLKKMFAFDIVCLIIWGGVFAYVLFGKKCPPGQFDGWCTSYNIGIACSCFLCIAYGCSVFFGIVDLHASKVSPRTRT